MSDTPHNVQVPSDYYGTRRYGSLERFISYYQQVDCLREYRGKKVLFVGVGDGMVPYYLKTLCGVLVTTLDFDPALNPDIVADVRKLPCEDNAFDAVAVFEVLEHFPFAELEGTLAELSRVSRGSVIVSLPYRHTGVDVVMKFPYIRTLLKRDFVRLHASLPIRFPGVEICKQHYWELDSTFTTFATVRAVLKKFFSIRKEYASFFDAYRYFFILQKKDSGLTDAFVRDYYNTHLQQLTTSYTEHRWQTSAVARFDYVQTLRALLHALSRTQSRDESGLEIGPGDGVWTRYLLPYVETLTLLDQSSEMIARAKATLHDHTAITYVIGDFLTYDPTEKYDRILAMRCFEYFENKTRAVERLDTLLAPGGTLVLVTKNPRYLSQQGKTDKLLHTDQIARAELLALFRARGLVVDAVYPATYRWKADYALFRFIFTMLHWLSVHTSGLVRIPWIEDRATESYLYIVQKRR